MKILEINSVNYGSTGSIMRNIAVVAEKAGMEVYTSCQFGKSTAGERYHRHIYVGNRIDRNLHLRLGKFTGKYGLFSKRITRKFIKKIDEIKPDLIHIHNLHKGYINIEILFDYIKKTNIPVVWTLHDCWSFTGQCPFFDRYNCTKWKDGCGRCPAFKEYPSNIDSTAFMYTKKKQCFLGVKNMTIVTPSQWLAGLVRNSFLKDYPVKVINNGIDLDVFKSTQSNLREKLNLEDKIIVLGVASIWDARKGLEVFEDLSRKMGDKYKFIVVGINEEQYQNLPESMIGIKRTNSTKELAEYYSVADAFFNPTLEDNFPTVNIEALACGTPVLTYLAGGSAECLEDGCGMVVTKDNIECVLKNFGSYNFSREKCIQAAKKYAANEKFNEYIKLYGEILG